MNMRPPGGLHTMPATSDLVGDRTNDSVAGWEPLSSGQIIQCLNDDISSACWKVSGGLQMLCGCSMQADLVISPGYHVCPLFWYLTDSRLPQSRVHRWPKYSNPVIPAGPCRLCFYLFLQLDFWARVWPRQYLGTIPIIIIETQASLSCWSIQWRKVNRI